jgi:hypothetical protein
LRGQTKGRVAAFARWSPPTRETVGFLCSASQRTSAATSTKKEEEALKKEALKKLATHLLSLTPQELDKAQRAGELMEVDCDAEN